MRYGADLEYEYRCPTKVIFGKKSHRQTRSEVNALGKRAVIVTDRPLAEGTDVVDRIQKILRDKFAGIFMDVEPDSSMEIVNQGTEYARSVGADCIVSVGGGSAIDTAKGISLVLKTGGTLEENIGVNLQTEPLTPHIAIPTTAGTGSEVTHVAVIRDIAAQRKCLILDGFLFPDIAIMDPLLTVSLPAHLTAATGMDALTHAIEARHGIYRNAFSDANALHAVRVIRDNLVTAVQEPKNIAARGAMLNAAALAGAAFTNSMVGVVHATAHSVGAICHVHHGLANSILLPAGIRFNAEWEPELYAPVAEALGVAERGMPDAEAAERAAAACYDLAKSCGIPTKLSEAGVKESDLEAIAETTMGDGAILNNPRVVMDSSEILALLEQVF